MLDCKKEGNNGNEKLKISLDSPQKETKISKKNKQRTKMIKMTNNISAINISEKKLYNIAEIVRNLLAQNASQSNIENITV